MNIALQYWLCLACTALLLTACQPEQKVVWDTYFQTLGSSSSIRCADLSGDGVLDVVIGAGKNETESSDSCVLALDGASGEVLWAFPGIDQYVGSATFLDINGDGTLDVIIGGRSRQLSALDGKSGALIWQYDYHFASHDVLRHMRFNFYDAQVVADQDNDGLADLLIINGGNAKVRANQRAGRYPGVLAILSSRDGAVIHADTMPDGNESYMTPVVFPIDEHRSDVLFGTGGETLGGALFRVRLDSFIASGLRSAEPIVENSEKGFIAPPVVLDINQDGVLDYVANWFGGSIQAFDGRTNALLWSVEEQDAEIYNTVTPGFINDDDIPDFFTSATTGHWPQSTGAVQLAIDGSSGEVIYRDTVGCVGFSGAVSTDLNGDGYDEFIFSTNTYACTGPFLADIRVNLIALDVHNKTQSNLIGQTVAKNISTTPWIGDLDDNGKLDLIYSLQANTAVINEYYGMFFQRIELPVPSEAVKWGAYLNHDGTSVFDR